MPHLIDKIFYNKPLSPGKSVDLAAFSIVRNLQHILNTRSSIGVQSFLSNNFSLNNLYFGLPDLSFLSPSSFTDRETIVKLISKAVTSFEPRLKNINIELGEYDNLNREMVIKVSADYNRDNIAVNFLLNLNTLEFLIDERER